ncbi:hypothetical protein [Xylanivirga thermophila]|uniref:hypothetical protein n=1 Tax=Xylanivirga thermophila TaxID=2496273 RepID=UPI00101D4BEC|nr:hypothetical protein [Xylanivirga thermophila]
MIYNTEDYNKMATLLIKLIDIEDNSIKEKIEKGVKELGIKDFLNSNRFENYPQEIKEKIYALKNILKHISERGGALWLQ